jgi:hypothetical protein
MSGHMYERFYLGNWVGAEGMIYTEYDYKRHLIDPFPIPKEWTRYLSIDFGFTNPFVCQWWAEDNDGRLYLYRELYGTQTTVEDWAHQIHDLSKGENYRRSSATTTPRTVPPWSGTWATRPQCIVGRTEGLPQGAQEPDRHDRGRQAPGVGRDRASRRSRTASALKAGDGRPRLFLFKGTLATDGRAADHAAKKPTCTEEEIDAYVWDEILSSCRGPASGTGSWSSPGRWTTTAWTPCATWSTTQRGLASRLDPSSFEHTSPFWNTQNGDFFVSLFRRIE